MRCFLSVSKLMKLINSSHQQEFSALDVQSCYTNLTLSGSDTQITLERETNLKTPDISMWWERWFLSSNAKNTGTLYLIFALLSGLLGTAFSVLIRLELSGPGVQHIASNQSYNSVITANAILMIFFMVLPAMVGGFGNFLLPLIVGGPGMAFPKLNSISFWLLPPSLILFLFAGTIENGAGTGWTLYLPLSGIQGYSGPSEDLAMFALYLSIIANLLTAINFVNTITYMRSPKINLDKLTLFDWAVVVTAVLLLLSLPILANKIIANVTDGAFRISFITAAFAGDYTPCSDTIMLLRFLSGLILSILLISIRLRLVRLLYLILPAHVKIILFILAVVIVVTVYCNFLLLLPFILDPKDIFRLSMDAASEIPFPYTPRGFTILINKLSDSADYCIGRGFYPVTIRQLLTINPEVRFRGLHPAMLEWLVNGRPDRWSADTLGDRGNLYAICKDANGDPILSQEFTNILNRFRNQ